MMKILLAASLAAAACLSACTPPDVHTPTGAGSVGQFDPIEAAVIAAIDAEGVTAGIVTKCPKGAAAELGTILARSTFDSTIGLRLNDSQRKRLGDARALHDRICGGAASTAPVASAAGLSPVSPG
jgi:hypothetical protein